MNAMFWFYVKSNIFLHYAIFEILNSKKIGPPYVQPLDEMGGGKHGRSEPLHHDVCDIDILLWEPEHTDFLHVFFLKHSHKFFHIDPSDAAALTASRLQRVPQRLRLRLPALRKPLLPVHVEYRPD